MDTADPRLVLNDPLDVVRLQLLLESSPDLSLVWLLARVPFDREQWCEALDAVPGHRSFWIAAPGDIIGHAGLRVGEREGERRPSFLFIKPEFRRQGVGRWLLHELELTASKLGATSLALTVRDYNLPAFHLYRAAGYKERSWTGSAIDMVKPI